MAEAIVNVVGPFVYINQEAQETKFTIGLNQTEKRVGCVMYIGPCQANSIAMALNQIRTPRPIIADTFISFLQKIEFKIEEVAITEIKESLYSAVIRLIRNNKKFELDVRATDAIIIALKSKAEIFVNEDLLSDGGFINLEEFSQPSSREKVIEEWFRNLDPNKIPKE